MAGRPTWPPSTKRTTVFSRSASKATIACRATGGSGCDLYDIVVVTRASEDLGGPCAPFVSNITALVVRRMHCLRTVTSRSRRISRASSEDL